MKLIFLGTGTSTGVPQLGCSCEVCHSKDPRDNRLRSSALLETDAGRFILIDCGPDFRQQMLRVGFRRVEAVLLTHEHYDHVGGIDDLRPFQVYGNLDVYADEICSAHLKSSIPYCFAEHKYPGVPQIRLCLMESGKVFKAAGVEVVPVKVMHGNLPVTGFRIGTLAYLTDVTDVPPESFELIKGAKVLVVDALRLSPHPTHFSLAQALTLVDKLQPQEVYFIHMSHSIGLHEEVERMLPPHAHLAYDGLEIKC